MGLFGKLKNAVTGGAAKMYLEVEQPVMRGEPATVRVRAVADDDIEADGVYLLVRAYEQAELKDTDFEDGEIEKEIVRGRYQSYETRVEVAGAQTLSEGEEQVWEAELTLPASSNPSIDGRMIRHTWEVQAGLDMTGNDPDTGWQEIEVR